jgi:hypothetical protein
MPDAPLCLRSACTGAGLGSCELASVGACVRTCVGAHAHACVFPCAGVRLHWAYLILRAIIVTSCRDIEEEFPGCRVHPKACNLEDPKQARPRRQARRMFAQRDGDACGGSCGQLRAAGMGCMQGKNACWHTHSLLAAVRGLAAKPFCWALPPEPGNPNST